MPKLLQVRLRCVDRGDQRDPDLPAEIFQAERVLHHGATAKVASYCGAYPPSPKAMEDKCGAMLHLSRRSRECGR